VPTLLGHTEFASPHCVLHYIASPLLVSLRGGFVVAYVVYVSVNISIQARTASFNVIVFVVGLHSVFQSHYLRGGLT